jgi:hypothetical protein
MQSSAHVDDTGHEEALVTVEALEILANTNELDACFSTDISGEVSRLLLRQGRHAELVYQNETEVQMFVIQALEDALETQGIFDDFAVRPEISIFAGCPDNVVITHAVLGVALVIDVLAGIA